MTACDPGCTEVWGRRKEKGNSISAWLTLILFHGGREGPAGLQGRRSALRPHPLVPKHSPRPSSAPWAGVGVSGGGLREGREGWQLSETPAPPPLASNINNNTIVTAVMHVQWALTFQHLFRPSLFYFLRLLPWLVWLSGLSAGL